MKVERKRIRPRKLILLLFAIGFAAAAVYFFRSEETIEFGGAAAALCFIFAVWFYFSSSEISVLVIDDEGIYDARICPNKIPWSEVESVAFEATYGNRFLCVRLKEPEKLISNLSGAKKDRVLFQQKLGFKNFNVDIGDLEVSLLDLKSHIESNFLQIRSEVTD